MDFLDKEPIFKPYSLFYPLNRQRKKIIFLDNIFEKFIKGVLRSASTSGLTGRTGGRKSLHKNPPKNEEDPGNRRILVTN